MSISAHACWAVKRTGERERDCVFECVQKVCMCVCDGWREREP